MGVPPRGLTSIKEHEQNVLGSSQNTLLGTREIFWNFQGRWQDKPPWGPQFLLAEKVQKGSKKQKGLTFLLVSVFVASKLP